MLGLRWPEVISIAAALAFSMILSFSRAICDTASATEDVGTSMIASTPSSNHSRAIDEAASGLFWWSALRNAISNPWLGALNS